MGWGPGEQGRAPQCVFVCIGGWGHIMGRGVSAPSGKEFPCIRAAQPSPRRGGGELPVPGGVCIRPPAEGIRWLIVQEAPWKLPEPGCQLLPALLPRRTTAGEGWGWGLLSRTPCPTPTSTPSGLPLSTRQLPCPISPQGTKRSAVPKITPDAKVIFQPGPRG